MDAYAVCSPVCTCLARLVICCQTNSVSAAHATHCVTYCTPCRPKFLQMDSNSTSYNVPVYTAGECPVRVSILSLSKPRKVDVRLPGKGNSNSHGARPAHLIITMIKWIQTSRLAIKNSLSVLAYTAGECPVRVSIVSLSKHNSAHVCIQ